MYLTSDNQKCLVCLRSDCLSGCNAVICGIGNVDPFGQAEQLLFGCLSSKVIVCNAITSHAYVAFILLFSCIY